MVGEPRGEPPYHWPPASGRGSGGAGGTVVLGPLLLLVLEPSRSSCPSSFILLSLGVHIPRGRPEWLQGITLPLAEFLPVNGYQCSSAWFISTLTKLWRKEVLY